MSNLKHLIKWNYYYNKIGKHVSWGYDNPDKHVSDFLNQCKHNVGDKVLDVGCGYGKNSTIFLSKKIKYIGIDISKIAILDAKNKYKDGVFICSNFLKYDFGNTLFDFIIDAGCIHVNHPSMVSLFLERYHSLLKYGGKLFIRIFKSDNENEEPLFMIDNLLPVWGYTEQKFRSYIDKSKFNIEKVILDKEFYKEDEVFYFYITKN